MDQGQESICPAIIRHDKLLNGILLFSLRLSGGQDVRWYQVRQAI